MLLAGMGCSMMPEILPTLPGIATRFAGGAADQPRGRARDGQRSAALAGSRAGGGACAALSMAQWRARAALPQAGPAQLSASWGAPAARQPGRADRAPTGGICCAWYQPARWSPCAACQVTASDSGSIEIGSAVRAITVASTRIRWPSVGRFDRPESRMLIAWSLRSVGGASAAAALGGRSETFAAAMLATLEYQRCRNVKDSRKMSAS